MNRQYGTDIIAINADFRQLLERGEKVAIFDVPVLITGESGTGKDVMARFIHDHSHRKEKAFVAINCAAIPDNLLETELFGYTKGTFTGQSKEGKAGLFEAARGGTLFWMRLVICHWLCRQNYCVFWNPKRICKWVAAK